MTIPITHINIVTIVDLCILLCESQVLLNETLSNYIHYDHVQPVVILSSANCGGSADLPVTVFVSIFISNILMNYYNNNKHDILILFSCSNYVCLSIWVDEYW